MKCIKWTRDGLVVFFFPRYSSSKLIGSTDANTHRLSETLCFYLLNWAVGYKVKLYSFFMFYWPCISIYTCKEKTNLMHNLFSVYLVKRYMFRAYLCPSSGGTTVCIQQLILIPYRWMSVWSLDVPPSLCFIYRSNKVNVKQSHYRPGQALRVTGGWGSQISRQSAHERGKVVSPTHRSPLPPRKYSWYSFLLEAESKDYVNEKNPMTPSGIEPAAFRLVVQCSAVPRQNVKCVDVNYTSHGCMNFPKIWQLPQNSRRQMGDMYQVRKTCRYSAPPYKFVATTSLCPGICVP
jgi:hypothetical protein